MCRQFSSCRLYSWILFTCTSNMDEGLTFTLYSFSRKAENFSLFSWANQEDRLNGPRGQNPQAPLRITPGPPPGLRISGSHCQKRGTEGLPGGLRLPRGSGRKTGRPVLGAQGQQPCEEKQAWGKLDPESEHAPPVAEINGKLAQKAKLGKSKGSEKQNKGNPVNVGKRRQVWAVGQRRGRVRLQNEGLFLGPAQRQAGEHVAWRLAQAASATRPVRL